MTTTPETSAPPPRRWRRATATLPLLVLAGLAVALAWHTPTDFDLPLHDRAGRDLFLGGGVPATNTYSFTAPDHRWLNHEWGFQALVAAAGNLAERAASPRQPADMAAPPTHPAARRVAGWQALNILLTALLVGAVAWQWRGDLAASRPPAANLTVLAPAALLALAMLWPRLILRPELASAVLLILVLGRVEACLGDPAARPPWRAILDPRQPGGQALLLTLLWYQLHGFAALAALLWVLGGLAGRSPHGAGRRSRLAALGLAAALAAGVVTPGGVPQLLYPLRVLAQFGEGGLDLQATISEMVPLLQTRDSLHLTLLAFKVSLVWAALWILATWPGLSRLRLLLFLLALVAAWQAQRNLGFYALTFLLLHGDLRLAGTTSPLARLAARLAPRRPARAAAAGLSVIVPVLVSAAALWWLAALPSDRFYLAEGVARRWGAGLAPANYPLEQAAILAQLGPHRTANNVNAASTLIAAGAGPVAIDGRTEAYPAAVWRDYRDLLAGQARTRQRLRDWRAEAVCLAHRTPAARAPLRTLLAAEEWALVQADESGVLFLRAGHPTVDPTAGTAPVLRAAADRLRREFAAASDSRHVHLADRGVALAALLQLADLPDLAEDLLGLSLERCPQHAAAHHNLGNLLLARGDLRGALLRFQAAARLNRNSAPPLVNAGSCLLQLGRPAEAARTLARATRRDPANFEAWANLAEVKRQLGDRAGAARAYRKALALRPDDQRLRARAQSLP